MNNYVSPNMALKRKLFCARSLHVNSAKSNGPLLNQFMSQCSN